MGGGIWPVSVDGQATDPAGKRPPRASATPRRISSPRWTFPSAPAGASRDGRIAASRRRRGGERIVRAAATGRTPIRSAARSTSRCRSGPSSAWWGTSWCEDWSGPASRRSISRRPRCADSSIIFYAPKDLVVAIHGGSREPGARDSRHRAPGGSGAADLQRARHGGDRRGGDGVADGAGAAARRPRGAGPAARRRGHPRLALVHRIEPRAGARGAHRPRRAAG